MTVAAGAGVSAETTNSTSGGSQPGSSDAGAQSAAQPNGGSSISAEEARDNATFARFGLKPDGTPLDPPATPNSDDEGGEGEGDGGTADEGDGAASGSDNADATAADDDEDDGEPGEITDEQLQRYVDALLDLDEEKIAKNPRLRARIEAEVRAQVEQQYEARQRAATASQERERLTGQGKKAVEALSTLLTDAQAGFANATAELKKAEAGQEFNPQIVAEGLKGFTPEQLQDYLAQYAQASTFDVARQHEDAFVDAFRDASAIGGPIKPEEVETINNIVNTANRIEADEKQGAERFAKAKTHYYGETVKFLTSRAYEAGRQAAIAEAKAQREARKTILDGDAVLAGAAKEAKRRGALPPSPTSGPPNDEAAGAATMEAYQAAKAAGDYDKADAIAARMTANAPQEAQRRLRR